MGIKRTTWGRPQTTMPSTPQKQHQQQLSTPKRRQQVLVSFRRKFGECMIEYVDTNQHLLQVMKSISHLRDRIVTSNSFVSKLQEEQPPPQEKKQQRSPSSSSSLSWKQYGFRGTTGGGFVGTSSSSSSSPIAGCYLTLHDVQDALSYDLLQHEKMLSGCRTTLSSLSTLLDTTSRRLDEWFEYDLQLQEMAIQQQQIHEGEDLVEDKYSNTLNVSNATHIYQYLASDLYHKQQLVQHVLDTSGDDTLLGCVSHHGGGGGDDDGIIMESNGDDDDDDDYDNNNDDGMNDGATTTNPRRAAKVCVKQWNRFQEGKHYEKQWQHVQDFVSFATNGGGG